VWLSLNFCVLSICLLGGIDKRRGGVAAGAPCENRALPWAPDVRGGFDLGKCLALRRSGYLAHACCRDAATRPGHSYSAMCAQPGRPCSCSQLSWAQSQAGRYWHAGAPRRYSGNLCGVVVLKKFCVFRKTGSHEGSIAAHKSEGGMRQERLAKTEPCLERLMCAVVSISESAWPCADLGIALMPAVEMQRQDLATATRRCVPSQVGLALAHN
jgi:hypothetical protein